MSLVPFRLFDVMGVKGRSYLGRLRLPPELAYLMPPAEIGEGCLSLLEKCVFGFLFSSFVDRPFRIRMEELAARVDIGKSTARQCLDSLIPRAGSTTNTARTC